MKESGVVTLGSGIIVERKLKKGKLVVNAYTEKEWAAEQGKLINRIKKLFK